MLGVRTIFDTGAVTLKTDETVTALPLVPAAEKVTVRVPVEPKFVNVHVHFFFVESAAVIVFAGFPLSVALTFVAA